MRPTSSVLRYRGVELDPLVAGRDLHDDYVVDGSLRRVGERLRRLKSGRTARVLVRGKDLGDRAARLLQYLVDRAMRHSPSGALIGYWAGVDAGSRVKLG